MDFVCRRCIDRRTSMMEFVLTIMGKYGGERSEFKMITVQH
jgi:hypothetical protein